MRVPLRPRDICALAIVGVFALAASGTHVIKNGETLGAIASQHGTTVRALVDANGISNPNLIIAGRTLTIPGASGGSGGGGSDASASSYTVRRGDTLASIATRHGTTVRALADANGISNPNLIIAGATLRLLAGASGGSSQPAALTSSGSSGGNQLPGQRHTVKPGDTIAGIAAKYGLSSKDLIAWNGLVDGKLYATTRLALYNPGTLPSAGSGSGGGSHTVARGETLGSIAGRYGVSSSAIASANGISNPNRIRTGQTLTIPGGGSSGSFVCPVPGGTYFNDWGFPRSGGRSHAGTDIFAARGTPVRAPVSGRLDTATGSIGGKQFRLVGSDGTLWFGSHLDAFGASGQVRAGDVIGYVGDSGNARGSRPHLHFEVHPGGTNAVNPYPLLRSSC